MYYEQHPESQSLYLVFFHLDSEYSCFYTTDRFYTRLTLLSLVVEAFKYPEFVNLHQSISTEGVFHNNQTAFLES